MPAALRAIARRQRPQRRRLRRLLGRSILKSLGFTTDIRLPNEPRFVLLLAPHTSNWDFVPALAAVASADLKANWFARHTIFRPIQALEQITQAFKTRDELDREASAKEVPRFRNRSESDREPPRVESILPPLPPLPGASTAPRPPTQPPPLPPVSAPGMAGKTAAPPSGILSVSVSTRSGSASGSDSGPTLDNFLPVGFVSATLLSGLDAPTGGLAQTNPHPVLLRLSDSEHANPDHRNSSGACRLLDDPEVFLRRAAQLGRMPLGDEHSRDGDCPRRFSSSNRQGQRGASGTDQQP